MTRDLDASYLTRGRVPPAEPISEYVREYTPKKSHGRAALPDWVLRSQYQPLVASSDFRTTSRTDFPAHPGARPRDKSRWAYRGRTVFPDRPAEKDSEYRKSFQGRPAPPSDGRVGNVNQARAWMTGEPTPYGFPDGDEPRSLYTQDFAAHPDHRPPAPVRYAKPNKLDKPFEATSLYADSFRPIDSSFVPEKRQRRRNGIDIFASKLQSQTTYWNMSKENKLLGFHQRGWGSMDVPGHPQPDETGHVPLIVGTAVPPEDRLEFIATLRKGSGQGLLEAGKGFHGESTYRSAHSQPELIRQAMTWNKRAEVHR